MILHLRLFYNFFNLILISRETEEPVNDGDKSVDTEKQLGQEDVGDANKENPVTDPEEKEPEDKVNASLIILFPKSFMIPFCEMSCSCK